jgi:hypothetical protein
MSVAIIRFIYQLISTATAEAINGVLREEIGYF